MIGSDVENFEKPEQNFARYSFCVDIYDRMHSATKQRSVHNFCLCFCISTHQVLATY